MSHFEYTGTNPKADFASIGNDPTTKNKWWPITDAYQIRLPGTPKGSQWLGMSQGMQIVGGQILGFVSGEWKGAPSKALTLIFVAIGLLMAAAVILALANTLSS